jgi:hypothetical protein
MPQMSAATETEAKAYGAAGGFMAIPFPFSSFAIFYGRTVPLELCAHDGAGSTSGSFTGYSRDEQAETYSFDACRSALFEVMPQHDLEELWPKSLMSHIDSARQMAEDQERRLVGTGGDGRAV